MVKVWKDWREREREKSQTKFQISHSRNKMAIFFSLFALKTKPNFVQRSTSLRFRVLFQESKNVSEIFCTLLRLYWLCFFSGKFLYVNLYIWYLFLYIQVFKIWKEKIFKKIIFVSRFFYKRSFLSASSG